MSRETLRRYVESRTGMRGLDPDDIHTVNADTLTLSSVSALLAVADAAAEWVEAFDAPADSIPGDNSWQYRAEAKTVALRAAVVALEALP